MTISKPTDHVPGDPWGIDTSTFTSLWGSDDLAGSKHRATQIGKGWIPESRKNEVANYDHREIWEMEMAEGSINRNRHAGAVSDPSNTDEGALRAEFEMGLELTRNSQEELSSSHAASRPAIAHRCTQGTEPVQRR